MAWTQTDIDALKVAIATGVLRVRYAGPPERDVTYQTTDAMLRALATMQNEVNVANGKPGYTLASYNKGV